MRPTGERKDTNVSKPLRTEHDLLGDRDISACAYYGVQTSRALANFAISGHPVAGHPDLVQALAAAWIRPAHRPTEYRATCERSQERSNGGNRAGRR